ncbi:FAD-binding oxidoreductase [Egibacter rhizosphaerae]|uniref:Delta(24)-sterol reductase n=1 Tax=Egibacter rhizosphaerae TaxID=1670831 RepID=A0A411YC08_9ACTN|nr:FAD-binding oxidoreductase [Egibacter rhizosphaerae]QBI18718.1 FAD-binding oxidoreductase [Egibacter rhizosphaerae]
MFQREGLTRRAARDDDVAARDDDVAASDDDVAARYERARADLQTQLAGSQDPVRLGKRTSNLFRPRERAERRLDVGAFAGVLEVDADSGTCDVLGMTTYEDLVAATLPHGVMPLVVPQLKTITIGGAVAGLGIESTSFRNGMPHESVLEMEILTGAGEVVVARPDNEHADLFWAFPNSYGTLGYALRLRIEVEPVQPYVSLRHLPYTSAEDCIADLERLCRDRELDGERVDFLDGTAFGPDELYLTVGTFSETAPYTSDYTGRRIYYRSIRERSRDYLTVHDYLWRWDTDWFWCSRAFGAQHPVVRRLWPKRWLRSDVYWRIIALEHRFGVKRGLDRLLRRPRVEQIVQDVEVPVDRSAAFLRYLFRDVGLSPVWLCPLQQRVEAPWDLYPLEPDTLYVNYGFWGGVPIGPGEAEGDRDRRVEQAVTGHGGRKSLYSTAYYPFDEFWELYGGRRYWEVKGRYDPDARLLDLYEKCVRRR